LHLFQLFDTAYTPSIYLLLLCLTTIPTAWCPKLTDDNWKPWSTLVKTHLESKDLLDFIINAPPADGTKPDAKKEAIARTLIIQAVGIERMSYIMGLSTAYKQWETLRKVHEPARQHRLATLSQSFYGYQLKPKPTVDKTASELTGLQSDIRLLDKDQAPTDQAKLAMLLLLYRCLNTVYEPVILHL